ncbi:hypothetical protein AVEN_238983-1 [Araneus ventricosus]|uniref:Uncharacterized protein n=1 Tax=Araneus ventricosus TaxID=182803 RepID=A0A4Y2U2T2_ARAVE|nr:hypothetical protein AVEN_238983-1 [Araneus ventricosus]
MTHGTKFSFYDEASHTTIVNSGRTVHLHNEISSLPHLDKLKICYHYKPDAIQFPEQTIEPNYWALCKCNCLDLITQAMQPINVLSWSEVENLYLPLIKYSP